MVLWQVTSYRQAVDSELERRHAITLLRLRYGRRWCRRAPADVVWMLRSGVAVGEACARVRAFVEGDGVTGVGLQVVDDAVAEATGVNAAARHDGVAAVLVSGPGARPHRGQANVGGEQFAEAVRLNREHWVEAGRPISAETLRKRLRIGAARSRALARAVRVGDRAAVSGVR